MAHEMSASLTIPELHYSAIFDALPGNNLLVQNDPPLFTILTATAAYLEQTGTSREAITGKGVFDAFPENNNEDYGGARTLLASFMHVIQKKESHSLPIQRYDLRNADGSFTKKYWRIINKPIISPDGEVAYIINTTEDITTQVKSEQIEEAHYALQRAYEKLAQSEQRFRALVTATSNVVYRMNADWTEMQSLQGHNIHTDTSEVIRDWEQKFLHPDEHGRVREAINQAIAEKSTIELEHQILDQEGKPSWTFSRAAPILDVAGKITEWFGAATDITQRKLSEEMMRLTEARYKTLFESMDQGFCVLEMIFDNAGIAIDYRFIEANPVFENQTGLANAVGKTAKELVPNLESHWFQLYGNVAVTGKPARFTEGSAAMGRWFDVYAFRIGYQDRKTVAVLFTDITERKKSEEALTEKDRHLRNIIQSAPVPMLVLRGKDMVVEMINERMLEMIGKTTTVIGKPLLESIPELEGQPGYLRFLQVYSTGNAEHGNEILVPLLRSGIMERRYFNFAYTPVLENGTIVGVMDVATEVTEQVLARKQLEQSNEEFRFALDLMPQMVWVTKADGYHDVFNKQWYEYTGMSSDATMGTGWSTVVHPDDLEPTLKIWQHSLDTGEPYQVQYRLKRYDGEYYWFLGRALPLKDESGKILKWYGTCTNIDDQRKEAVSLEEKVDERTKELIKTNQELARSNQNLEEFAYAASHDLKEPVRKIQFFTQKLRDQLKNHFNDAEEKSFIRIQNAAERMGNLIDDLLLYSHVSQRPLEKESVDLNQKLQRVLEDLELDIYEKGALINFDGLPTIKGYRRQLQQLFQNLISNALKYSKVNVPPQVDITGKLVTIKDRQYHRIAIRDNGIGFEQEYAEKIFQMFTRLHAMSEYRGTGVGLSIVKKVIENHEGFITVESKPDEGSMFVVYLPAEE